MIKLISTLGVGVLNSLPRGQKLVKKLRLETNSNVIEGLAELLGYALLIYLSYLVGKGNISAEEAGDLFKLMK